MTRKIIFFTYILLTFYSFGASMLDYFGIYESWKLVGEEEFAELHTFQGKRIIAVFVIPCAVTTLLGLAACLFPVKNASRLWLWLSLTGLAIVWILSFSIQIPIQFKLDKGKDMQLLDELLETNWYRYFAGVFQVLCVIILAWNQFFRNGNKETPHFH